MSKFFVFGICGSDRALTCPASHALSNPAETQATDLGFGRMSQALRNRVKGLGGGDMNFRGSLSCSRDREVKGILGRTSWGPIGLELAFAGTQGQGGWS